MQIPALRDALKRALQLPPSRLPRRPEAGRAGCVVVLGVGSELRSDDAAGVRVAERLASSAIPNVHAIASGPAPENATAEIRRLSPSHLVIVDAADLREAPGTVRLVPRDAIEGASFGTHGLPLSVLAGYLEAEVGCAVIFIGIQPASLAFGEDLSPEVAAAVQETLQVLRECLTPPPSAAPAGAS